MMENYKNHVLLLIDVQVGIDDLSIAERNNPMAESNIEKLLNAWRDDEREVIHVKHNSESPGSPLRPDQPGNQIQPWCLPLDSEMLFEKTVNSAFIGTGLENHLRERNITDLIIAGLTTDHCVSTSTRMAANLGFNVALVGDATATFGGTDKHGRVFSADDVHAVNLYSLDGEFCLVVETEEVLATMS